MPANHGLRANNDQGLSPSRPKPRQRDPERAIERRESRPAVLLGIGCELLTEGKLDNRLLLATPEEGEHAVEKGD
jgi:hypothetical protein